MSQNYLITDSVPRLSLDSLPLIEGKTPLIIDGNPVVAINRNTLGERTQNIATDKFQSYVVPSYTGYQPVSSVLEAEQIARAYPLGSMNEDPIRIRKQGGIISYVDYLK